MEGMTDHQRNVQKALEGNERVWFHPTKDRLAVWYGGARVSIFNSRTWEEVGVFQPVIVEGLSIGEIEDAVTVFITDQGFDRCGRTKDDTRLRQEE